ncbi:hypothetical protein GTY88_40050 [Streptomyces sp. SID5926]|nr:hypothetical protein [Streptomyces sp. SID5926]
MACHKIGGCSDIGLGTAADRTLVATSSLARREGRGGCTFPFTADDIPPARASTNCGP